MWCSILLVKASIQAVRAITGVYFQKLISTGAAVGAIILAGLWALIIWLTTSVDPLWGLFFISLIPATIIAVVIYGLMKSLGQSMLPRRLSDSEKKIINHMGDKVFSVAEAAGTPWIVNAFLVAKDVIRGRESQHIRHIISNTSTLKDDFLQVRRFFE